MAVESLGTPSNKFRDTPSKIVRQVAGFEPMDETTNAVSKTFVIGVIALGAIALLVGALALMACQGVLPACVGSTISNLSQLGFVNSSLIAGAGLLLIVAGSAGLIVLLKRDQSKSGQQVARKLDL